MTTGLIILILVSIVGYGLWTHRIGILYGICAILLGVSVAGTSLGDDIQGGLRKVSGAVNQVSAKVGS